MFFYMNRRSGLTGQDDNQSLNIWAPLPDGVSAGEGEMKLDCPVTEVFSPQMIS